MTLRLSNRAARQKLLLLCRDVKRRGSNFPEISEGYSTPIFRISRTDQASAPNQSFPAHVRLSASCDSYSQQHTAGPLDRLCGAGNFGKILFACGQHGVQHTE